MRLLTIVSALLAIVQATSLQAQLLPPNQPEQEPCNALQICGSFYTPYSYQGVGSINNLPNTPCMAGEDNSVWFKLNVTSSGTLVFKIVPVLPSDDYDWALLNGTGKDCSSIGYADVIRCNFNANVPISAEGQTGLSMESTLTSVLAGTTGQNFCRYVDVLEGETYYLMINNFGIGGTPTSGFYLDFEGSTATFNTPPAPQFESVVTSNCDIKNQVRIKLSEMVLCSSIAPNGSDFTITPSGTITSAVGADCTTGGYTDEIIITFSENLAPGSYTLHAATGTDGNTLLNLCEVPLELPDQLSFNVYNLRDTVDISICSGQIPYVWNGITVLTGGLNAATFTAPNYAGCDSVTVLNLFIVDTIVTDEYLTLCTNQLPYTWNGITVTEAGSPAAVYHTLNAAGCDSLTRLMLTVTPPKWVTQNLTLCSYQLPYDWNGIIIPEEAVDSPNYDTFATTTSTGCDSFTILNLNIVSIEPVNIFTDTHVCGYLDFKGHRYFQDTLLSDTLRAATGCDSVYVDFQVYVHNNTPTIENIRLFGCDSVTFRGTTYYSGTLIVDSFTSIWGCDSFVRNHNIVVEHFELDLLSNADTIVEGEYSILTARGNMPFEIVSWQPIGIFSNQHLYEQVIRPHATGEYIVTGVSPNGCIDTGRTQVIVMPLVPDMLMPNAFSPNGDGLNDIFAPKFFHESGYIIRQFMIYNRWGNLVYHLQNSRVKGWDGTNQNTNTTADAGVYYYYIEVEFVNGQIIKKKGDVTLVR